MDYPNCGLRCNGLLNCQQMDQLLASLVEKEGREDVVSIYSAMLHRSYKNCPLRRNCTEELKVVSMY